MVRVIRRRDSLFREAVREKDVQNKCGDVASVPLLPCRTSGSALRRRLEEGRHWLEPSGAPVFAHRFRPGSLVLRPKAASSRQAQSRAEYRGADAPYRSPASHSCWPHTAKKITRRAFSVYRSNIVYSTAAAFRLLRFQYKYPGTPISTIAVPQNASVGRVKIVFSVHTVPIRT